MIYDIRPRFEIYTQLQRFNYFDPIYCKEKNTKVDPKVMSHYSPNFNIHKIDNFFLYVFVLAQVPWILCAPLY